MRRGELVPSDVILSSLQNRIDADMREGKRQFIIDGFPRSLEQALLFEENEVETSLSPNQLEHQRIPTLTNAGLTSKVQEHRDSAL